MMASHSKGRILSYVSASVAVPRRDDDQVFPLVALTLCLVPEGFKEDDYGVASIRHMDINIPQDTIQMKGEPSDRRVFSCDTLASMLTSFAVANTGDMRFPSLHGTTNLWRLPHYDFLIRGGLPAIIAPQIAGETNGLPNGLTNGQPNGQTTSQGGRRPASDAGPGSGESSGTGQGGRGSLSGANSDPGDMIPRGLFGTFGVDTAGGRRRPVDHPGQEVLPEQSDYPPCPPNTPEEQQPDQDGIQNGGGNGHRTENTNGNSTNRTIVTLGPQSQGLDEDEKASHPASKDWLSKIYIPQLPSSNPEVFSNRYFAIKRSDISGLGAFAQRDLKRGWTIHVERAVIEATEDTLYDELDKLTPDLKQAFSRLHAYFETPNLDPNMAILRTNGFTNRAAHGGLSMFLVASRFNNACQPRNNVEYYIDKARHSIIFKTRTNIPAGTELTISYGAQPRTLLSKWGFRCSCGACQPLTDEECHAILNPPKIW
ncbi:hypothetical protein DL764_000535 [Monosporascus ibericus]|uniref:SET domain-containing protein n=1 Tax=Monosporascus ibericus TaxID=155417 RepID=A0A4Q4TT99_9PEZI|nr:hypothetical protein DL764_000535 [Monosporascus ibericus]